TVHCLMEIESDAKVVQQPRNTGASVLTVGEKKKKGGGGGGIMPDSLSLSNYVLPRGFSHLHNLKPSILSTTE
ncbi:MAG: hypothetical protein OXC53_07500, partial [Rhodobacteraceae bacterium]|nr:hypothetical protein [Paracoccaceae bacterium]